MTGSSQKFVCAFLLSATLCCGWMPGFSQNFKKVIGNYPQLTLNGGNCIRSLSNGDLIIAGASSYGAGVYDAYLMRTNNSGQIKWFRTYGSADSDQFNSVRETSDKGFICTGGFRQSMGASGDILVLKTDSAGIQTWATTIGGSPLDYGISIFELQGGGYMLSATTINYGNQTGHPFLIRLDSQGNVIWQKFYGSFNTDDWFRSIVPAGNNRYALCGHSELSQSGNVESIVLMTDTLGNPVWTRSLGFGVFCLGQELIFTKNRKLVFTGYTQKPMSSLYYTFIAEMDTLGNLNYFKTFGLTSYSVSSQDIGRSIIETSDSGLVVVGQCNYDWNMVMLKTDLNAQLKWARLFASPWRSSAMSVTETKQGNLAACGSYRESNGHSEKLFLVSANNSSLSANCDSLVQYSSTIETPTLTNLSLPFFTVNPISAKFVITTQTYTPALDSMICGPQIIQSGIVSLDKNKDLLFYPNPCSNLSCITFKNNKTGILNIYDQFGRLVFHQEINTIETTIDIRNLPSALYHWTFSFENSKIQAGKVVILRDE